MNQGIELFKKAGAGLIIVVLAVMMGLTFSSQPLSEITEIISGSRSLGEFQGEEIAPSLYIQVESSCKERYSSFSNVPAFFIDSCVSGQLKQLYGLPSLGKKLGIQVSEESIQQDLLRQVRNAYESQSGFSDDRLSMKEIYRRELLSSPMDVRMQVEAAQKTVENLDQFPGSEEVARADALADQIVLQLRVIRYTRADLLRNLERSVSIPEEHIRKEYEKEQKEKPEKERKPYESERPIIENRLKQNLKQVELASLKKRLAGLKEGYTLEDVQRIVGVKPAVPLVGSPASTRITLRDIKSLQLPGVGGAVNLALPDFLLQLSAKSAPFVSGPLQDGDSTLYVEVRQVVVPPYHPGEEELKKRREQSGRYVAAYLLDYLINREMEKGEFKLNIRSEPPGQQ